MWKKLIVASVIGLLHASSAIAQTFGYTTSSDATKWVINSGKGLSITMVRSTCDIVSIKYNSQELQYKAKATHIGSGLGTVTSSITTLTDTAKTIQVTCEKTGLTQYYFFRPLENAIYMGTYHSSDLPLGELRFLARLDRATVTSGIAESTMDGTTRAIEATDVYASDANITRSKFYSGVPFIRDQIHGVRGPKAGVYFVMSPLAYETSISGPFYRDINSQTGTANDLTFYMNSDHTRTEEYRYGFHGPYALVFTDGAAPASTSVTNFDFFQPLALKGFVPTTQRGKVTGTITDSAGVLGKSSVVVAFKNDAAQYWTELTAGARSFTSPMMKAGTYTVTVFKKQLPVGTGSVTVTTGQTTTQNLQVTFTANPNAIWQIGEWDGTPEGFLNADKIHGMHPSDARMAPWVPLVFSADKDADAKFPMAQFRGVNDPITVTFDLSASEAAAQRVLKIGVSLAQSSGRPSVRVNDKWSAAIPATQAVKTRGITRGSTTGNYVIYEYKIPATALVTGLNKIALGIASGNSDPAEPFLHASVVFDALQFE